MAELRIVLASGSPRRRELLGRIGISPDVRPADLDETPHPGENAEQLVRRLSEAKANSVPTDPDTVVIAADTVVVCHGEVLGKPVDDADAMAMLTRLSATMHTVVTGVHVRRGDRHAHAVESTEVHLRAISDAEIAAYIATGEPADKAGAYAVQGAAGMFVDRLVGSDTNVIGLPLATVVRLLAEVGVTVLPGRIASASEPV